MKELPAILVRATRWMRGSRLRWKAHIPQQTNYILRCVRTPPPIRHGYASVIILSGSPVRGLRRYDSYRDEITADVDIDLRIRCFARRKESPHG